MNYWHAVVLVGNQTERQRRQNGDDGNLHQQFDEREGATLRPLGFLQTLAAPDRVA